MPYISQQQRVAVNQGLRDTGISFVPKNGGELNYIVTSFILNYLETHGFNYQHMQDMLGSLDGASKEFYRRIVGPYEDDKILENGDVYGPEGTSGNSYKRAGY